MVMIGSYTHYNPNLVQVFFPFSAILQFGKYKFEENTRKITH